MPTSDSVRGAPGLGHLELELGAQRAAVSCASLPMLEEHAMAKVKGCFMDKLRARCTEGRKYVSLPCRAQDAGPWPAAM